MSALHTSSSLIWLTLLSFSPISTNDSAKVDSATDPITSASQAVAKVLKVTGFADLSGLELDAPDEVAEVTRFADSTFPFLSGNLDGSVCWKVELRDVVLQLSRTTRDQEQSSPFTVRVYVDSLTGQLLLIQCTAQNRELPSFREPTAVVATRQLADLGEIYHALPDVAPTISMMQALDKCGFYPLLAREIRISYVVYSLHVAQPQSTPRLEPRPAWIVYMRGLPPVSGREGVPDHQTTNRRTVVDAVTGQTLWTVNTPYPELNDDTD